MPETLVWKNGMSQWRPFSEVGPEVGPGMASQVAIPSDPSAPVDRCIECGKHFDHSQIVQISNMWVCASCKPAFLHKLTSGQTPGGVGAVWRSKKDFVVKREGSELPERCVRCNCAVAPEDRLKRAVSWYPPAILLLLLLSPIVLLIVAAAVQKKATLYIGICPEHRRKRRNHILIAWGLFVVGVACIARAVMLELGIFGLGAAGLILIALIWGTVGGRVVHATKINKEYAFIRGACPEYLDQLPDWTGG